MNAKQAKQNKPLSESERLAIIEKLSNNLHRQAKPADDMNNQQKAEDFAKEQPLPISSVDFKNRIKEAVLHGIEIGHKDCREAYEDDKTPPMKTDWPESKPMRGGFAEEP